MNILDGLSTRVGNWHGRNTLQDPHTNAPEDSPATATVTPVLGGRFVRFDYTWGYQGKAQEGSILFGFDVTASTINAYWIDSWHMGDKMMICEGLAGEGNNLSVRGSYAAPSGPDWGWRIDLQTIDEKTIRMIMYNITPDGTEHLAMESLYTRN